MTKEVSALIEGCRSNDRLAQETMYRQFYGYAMSICLPHSSDRAEAEEIAQDGFMKIFTKIDQYDSALSFKAWIRRIFINSSIDYFRKQKKHYFQDDIDNVKDVEDFDDNVIDQLSANDILQVVQKLSPAYQMVFNLNVIEGYQHSEIAEQLGITEATSRSNLAKARNKLKEALGQLNWRT